MKYTRLLGPLALVLATGCAGTLGVQTQIVNDRAIQADYDTTWDAVVTWFALTNNPIATIEKDSGIIATEQLTEAGTALDCGDPGYGYSYGQPEIRLNVFVREITSAMTDIRVTVTGRVLRYGSIGATASNQSTWRTCYSRGSFERDMIESISQTATRSERGPRRVVSAPEQRPTTSLGSGFILPSRTIAATNHHVIEGASSVEVWNPFDGEWLPSRVVRFDVANDLALVEVPEAVRPAASTPAYGVLASTGIRVGAEVHTIGFPLSSVLGSRPRFTTGTISADVGIRDDPRLLQITTPIQPGNSGGPLVDAYGRVIGVVVSTLNSSLFLERTGSVPQNVNFAIKIDYLRLLAGNDFGLPGDTPAAALEGSDVAERMIPWVVRIRAIQN